MAGCQSFPATDAKSVALTSDNDCGSKRAINKHTQHIYIILYLYLHTHIYIYIHISDISQQPNVDWWLLVAFREAQGEAGLDDLAWRRTQLQQLELATCIFRPICRWCHDFSCMFHEFLFYLLYLPLPTFTYLYLLLMLLQWVQTSNSGPFSQVNTKQYETIWNYKT